MAEAAPSVDDILTTDDSANILEELHEAQNHSYLLGLMLKLKTSDVKAIHATYQEPKERLSHVITEFLNQTKPRPTWRVIINALRTRTVNLQALAKRIESTRFPDPTSTRNVVPEMTVPVPALKGEIMEFHRRFNSIKESTIHSLEKCHIAVVTVVYLLTSVLPVHAHKKFVEEKYDTLCKSETHLILFGKLNLYWNAFSYGLFHGLLEELVQKDKTFENIKVEMMGYIDEMEKFKETTTLVLFCEVAPDVFGLPEDDNPPPGFQKMVTEHHWPETVTLKSVGEFQRKFSHVLGLAECAMLVNRIRRSCFEITWFAALPASVIQLLRGSEDAVKVFSNFKVVFAVIDGECVYQQHLQVQYSRADLAMKFFRKTMLKKPAKAVTKQLLKSPLTKAVMKGTLQDVKELIASGEDPNPHTVSEFKNLIRETLISTPLKEACRRGDLEIAQALLEAGADPNLVTDNWTALMEASRLGSTAMIKLFIEFGANPNTTNSDNWTALMAASNNGQREAVDQLLQYKANPNMRDHVGWSALLASVFKSHEKITLSLTEAGANPHLQNILGKSALRLAMQRNQNKVVETFLNRHPTVKPGLCGHPELDFTDKHGETDLLFSCKKNRTWVVRLILSKGANPNLQNQNAEFPLFIAVRKKNSEMIEELLRFGANPNKKTEEGTLLAIAAKNGEIKMAELMLKAGADPNIAEYAEQHPLYHAKQQGNRAMIELLEKYNANDTGLPSRASTAFQQLTEGLALVYKTITGTS